jgi:hypothetical protein
MSIGPFNWLVPSLTIVALLALDQFELSDDLIGPYLHLYSSFPFRLCNSGHHYDATHGLSDGTDKSTSRRWRCAAREMSGGRP